MKCAATLAAATAHPSLVQSVRRISFEFCNELQNFDLEPLGAFENLTALNLNACRSLTDSAIEIVAERCHKLERLDLFWCVTLTDIAIRALASASFPPRLRHLNLSGLKHVTDAALVPLLRRCTNLTWLDLTRCEGMRDESMRAVGATCRHLSTLLLYATPHVTDVGLEALGPAIAHLTYLDITGMKFVHDRGIQSLVQHAPQLRVLHLQWVTALTDESLVAMGAARLPHLELLSIHGNIHMTAAGIEALARGCPNIEQIDVNGCKNLGPYRMNKEALQRVLPKLRKITML